MTTLARPAAIAPRELRPLLDQDPGVFILDVRSPLEFEGEHIAGARLLPLDQLDVRLGEIPDDADIVVVCRTGVRATVAAEALARGGRRARVLEGGMNAWRRAGLPLRIGRRRLPVDRQVQLTVGVGVLAGVALGLTVSPWFFAVPAFFGAGLIFAGATGTCSLALLLATMPWNRPLTTPTDNPGAVCAAGGASAPSCAAPASRS